MQDLREKHKTRICLQLIVSAALIIGSTYSLGQVSDHTYTSESIETGSRVYVQQCALCHGPDGGWVSEINLARGQFRTAVTDDDLREVVSKGAAQGRMPAFHLSDSDLAGLIAYIRIGFEPDSTPVRIGDVSRGKNLFEGDAACHECHRINGRGPRTAPDLSDIGLIRTPGALQRSLLEPSTALLPIHRAIRIITGDEETITGRRLNEDTYTVQLIDSNERLRSLVKADLVSYEISDTPTHTPTMLSGEEVADLIAYLLAQRGQL